MLNWVAKFINAGSVDAVEATKALVYLGAAGAAAMAV